jgi:O-6-methylguanine DNA methyltransferase
MFRASLSEILLFRNVVRNHGNKNLFLLYCFFITNAIMELKFHLQIEYSQNGICSVSLLPVKQGFHWNFSSDQPNENLEALVNAWLEAYCQKKNPSIQLPFDWASLPAFTQKVLQAVAAIPFGSFSTYGQIAHLLGRPEAARAVGGACGRNPFLLLIPCHRVLDAKQELRGYSAGGIGIKHMLLSFEGSK